MATQVIITDRRAIKLDLKASFSQMRALAWDGDALYASHGYSLFSARMNRPNVYWRPVAQYRPPWWRSITSHHRLSFRLVRDGFHALSFSQGNLIAAVPGAICTLRRGEKEFQVSHRLERGTRPLHFATLPSGRILWGEYFDNPDRDAVHIYASGDAGLTWDVAYSFGRNSIRHVHNIIYDKWANCLWIFTGDYGQECRVLRASPDLKTMKEVIGGNQQARAVAVIVEEHGLYFASDTPLERNQIHFLDRQDRMHKVKAVPSSSIHACQNRTGMFFSTMVEPSEVNRTRSVALFGSESGEEWRTLAAWTKDRWPMKYFQYGNVLLPDGENTTDWLAASTIAVEGADLKMFLWKTTFADPALNRSGSISRSTQFAML